MENLFFNIFVIFTVVHHYNPWQGSTSKGKLLHFNHDWQKLLSCLLYYFEGFLKTPSMKV